MGCRSVTVNQKDEIVYDESACFFRGEGRVGMLCLEVNLDLDEISRHAVHLCYNMHRALNLA